MIVAPEEFRGGQHQVVAVGDGKGGRPQVTVDGQPMPGFEDYALVNGAWATHHVTISVPNSGMATSVIDPQTMEVTQQFDGTGGMNTESGRFGSVLAGETGDVTLVAEYSVMEIPDAKESIGQAYMSFGNNGVFQTFSTNDAGAAKEGEIRMTVRFNAGDMGTIAYGVELFSQRTTP